MISVGLSMFNKFFLPFVFSSLCLLAEESSSLGVNLNDYTHEIQAKISLVLILGIPLVIAIYLIYKGWKLFRVLMGYEPNNGQFDINGDGL